MPEPDAIQVKDLYFRYEDSDTYILKGVSFSIERGEKVAIVGENGAGKTTLIKHFNGLLKPTKGSVRIFSIDTKTKTVAELSRRVGLVFQNPDHQFFEETVEKEIEFALKNFNFDESERKRIVSEMLRFFELEKYRDRSPFLLSGGEKKRLAIASVLCYNPDILVLDEPTVGQDPIQKEKLSVLLDKIVSMGKTVVVVSHDMDFVAENFSRVIVLSKGVVIADGKTENVLTNESILNKARLLPPQVTLCAWSLSNIGLRRDIIRVDDIVEEILLLLQRCAPC
ncbi:MAG: ABC transporter ATP-binding protein [Thermoprotei archaeon]|nr:MAG: ABC transporter ATP-binding protein [Thermoprotei archaeon]RLF01067.1 MAG: ABC transporter ATP-binding protein [Thermoprotei archaeon]HDI75237.1 ABC transporter ATP-binding protein [Thermoprotei archaeon]